MGLNIYQITNSNAILGGGHTAMITASGNNYQIQSYGSGFSGSASSSGSNGVTTMNFGSLQAAFDAALSQGYDRVNQWNTDAEQDAAARSGFTNYANSAEYHVSTHNCADAVHAGMESAGIDHDSSSNTPNTSHTLNKIYADSSSVLTKSE
ncbi:MAG: hypothetical protein Q8Q59_05495 [Luteolibacter sp.]|jgi:hypothetical protein|nr:hypothetical protein [Luteolibacter sp.]